MKLIDVKNGLFVGLNDIAQEFEFKIIKSQFSLIKKEKDRVIRLGFTYNTWFDEIQIFPDVIIDFNAVVEISKKFEDVVNYTAFINLLLLKQQMTSYIDNEIRWKMQYENKDRIKIFNNDDIQKALEQITSLFVDYGLEYFKTYSTIDSIDRMYNANPISKFNPNCSGYNMHCLIGLIAAKLSSNPKYKELSEIYSKEVIDNDFTDRFKNNFFNIKMYLG